MIFLVASVLVISTNGRTILFRVAEKSIHMMRHLPGCV